MLLRSFIYVGVLQFCAAASRAVKAVDIPQRGSSQIGASKIVGSSALTIDYPWQAAQMSPTGIRRYFDGSIISDEWILLAAHSADKFESGLYNSLNDVAQPAERYRNSVARIVMHPNYSSNSLDNDIALVNMELPINYGGEPFAYPNLPRIGETFTGDSKCYRIERRERNQVFNSIIMLDADCKRIFPKMKLDHTKICTINGPSGNCSADYYYELICIRPNSRTPVLVGIEGGKRRMCTQKPYRTVYTSVAAVRNWIYSVTGL